MVISPFSLCVCVCVCLCVCLLISRSFFNRFSSVIHGWTRLCPGQGPIIINWWIIQGVSKETALKSILYCFFVHLYTTTKLDTLIAFHNLNHVSKFEGNWLKTRVLVAIFVKGTLIVKSITEGDKSITVGEISVAGQWCPERNHYPSGLRIWSQVGGFESHICHFFFLFFILLSTSK